MTHRMRVECKSRSTDLSDVEDALSGVSSTECRGLLEPLFCWWSVTSTSVSVHDYVVLRRDGGHRKPTSSNQPILSNTPYNSS